jgi:CHAT domain-containing protein
MGCFYHNLAKGLPKARALQRAKQAMRARGPHPRDWAGFVLVGNPV